MNWHLEEMYLWRRLNVQTIGGGSFKDGKKVKKIWVVKWRILWIGLKSEIGEDNSEIFEWGHYDEANFEWRENLTYTIQNNSYS